MTGKKGAGAPFLILMNNYENDYEFDDAEAIYIDEVDEPTRFWTTRRIALTIFAILIVVALFLYSYSGLFIPPPPLPTPLPRPSV